MEDLQFIGAIEKLNIQNYSTWHTCMESYLQWQDLWEIVQGSDMTPPFIENAKGLRMWQIKAGKAMFIIKITVEKDMLENIRHATTPKEAWDALAHLQLLKSELTITAHKTSQHFTEVNKAGTSQLSNLDTENQESKFVHDKEEEQRKEGGGGDSCYSGELEEEEREHREVEDQSWRYLPLHIAALKGDWDSARRIFSKDKDAITAQITRGLLTTLHVAVGTGKAINFIEKLVELMPPEALARQTTFGDTALHFAARMGNTKAVDILVNKNPGLVYIKNEFGTLPVHVAALYSRRGILMDLLTVTKADVESNPFEGKSGTNLLVQVIVSELYDVALDLVQRYPQFATSTLDNGDSPLKAIARKPSAFSSGSRLNFWERLIYYGVPGKLESYPNNFNEGDAENPIGSSQVLGQICSWSWVRQIKVLGQKLHMILWEVIQFLVPHVKHIKHQKLIHHQALQLVKLLCKEIKSLNDSNAYRLHSTDAILGAAMLNINEVVEEITEIFPCAAWSFMRGKRSIFHVAVQHRSENVFNLIYQMSDHRECMIRFRDTFNCSNNILHVAGLLAPPSRLKLVPGAALQMQRELQWFKEVEKFLTPDFQEMENSDKKTPATVFTECHKDLVIEGEKWMKDTATSCTVAAALIVTVVFAAAITVPGGNNNDDGHPIFSKERAFIVFVISNAISLFTSTTSLLMFLSILTSRYAESDFLLALPRRLIIGLVSLFLSITSMMITFSATLYLVFALGKAWILIPVAACACLPITCFVYLQFPLLIDVMFSTYGPKMFGKKSNRPFY